MHTRTLELATVTDKHVQVPRNVGFANDGSGASANCTTALAQRASQTKGGHPPAPKKHSQGIVHASRHGSFEIAIANHCGPIPRNSQLLRAC